jgi:hypothetical protein
MSGIVCVCDAGFDRLLPLQTLTAHWDTWIMEAADFAAIAAAYGQDYSRVEQSSPCGLSCLCGSLAQKSRSRDKRLGLLMVGARIPDTRSF